MIIKGKAVKNTKHWSRYLLKAEVNEKTQLHDLRGVLATDLAGALEEMRDVAKGSRCQKNFMYHASFNPRAHETLTPEQWRRAIDIAEKELGFAEHQRIVVEHIKDGRQHYHVIWSRIDPDTMRVRDIGGDRYALRRAANEIEREFGLSRTKAVREYNDLRPHKDQDKERAKRTGINPDAMTKQLTEVWQRTSTGVEFKKEVEVLGYAIARGDRVKLAVIDSTGGIHSLSRRLEGVDPADRRKRFAEISRVWLPSIEQSQKMQLSHLKSQMTKAWNNTKTGAEFKKEVESLGYTIARGDQVVYALIDPVGGIHSLSRRIDGVRAKDLRERFADIDRTALPTVKQVCERLKESVQGWEPSPASVRSNEDQEQGNHRKARETSILAKSLSSDDYVASATLEVIDAVTGNADKLADFVLGLLSGSTPKPRGQGGEIIAERRAKAALHRMAEAQGRGERLQTADVAALTHHQLLNIRDKGDDYMRQLIDDNEKERRERYFKRDGDRDKRDWDNERER